MNLQERLLQNEIKHLGQIIQTLSYELIVLQDFLKDEYGSKFENFRKKLSNTSRSSVGSRRSQCHKRIINSATSDEVNNSRRSVSQDNAIKKGAEDVTGVGKSENSMSMDDSFDESENDDYEISDSVCDSETSITLRDPLETESNMGRKGGRRQTRIWKFFDKIVRSDNKFSARCHLCQRLVSSRAVRMVEHRLKCKRKLHADRISGTRDIKQDLKTGCSKEKSLEISKNDDDTDKEISDAAEGVEAAISNDRGHNESGSCNSQGQDKGCKKSGRMLDTIWHYFEIVYQNNMKKAKCTSCGQYISPKAIRLRQHKMACKGAGLTKSNGNL